MPLLRNLFLQGFQSELDQNLGASPVTLTFLVLFLTGVMVCGHSRQGVMCWETIVTHLRVIPESIKPGPSSKLKAEEHWLAKLEEEQTVARMTVINYLVG